MKRDESIERFERDLEDRLDRFFLQVLGRCGLALAALSGSHLFLTTLALNDKQLAGAGIVMGAMIITGCLLSAPGR